MKSIKQHIRCKGANKILKVYNNIMNSIKLQYKVDSIFINSKNSKKSDAHRLLINLSDKVNLKTSDKYVIKSNPRIDYT